MTDNSFIVQNAVQTPDGTILISTHRHDYQSYTDGNGHTYMVDGGYDYIRRAVPIDENGKPMCESLTLHSDSPFEEVREKLLWGTYGRNGEQPLSYVRLKDMEENHIVNVLQMIKDDTSIRAIYRRDMMQRELKHRKLSAIVGKNQTKRGGE
jgi:hypothetical protein